MQHICRTWQYSCTVSLVSFIKIGFDKLKCKNKWRTKAPLCFDVLHQDEDEGSDCCLQNDTVCRPSIQVFIGLISNVSGIINIKPFIVRWNPDLLNECYQQFDISQGPQQNLKQENTQLSIKANFRPTVQHSSPQKLLFEAPFFFSS